MAAVKTQHLLIFTRQFAAMIASQLPLVQVLENLWRETPQKQLRATLGEVLDRVLHGIDLGDALAMHPRVFGLVYVNVVKAGMESGNLANALLQIAAYLSNMDEIGRKFRKAVTYPMFMFGAFFVVFNIMVTLILPNFKKMFESSGSKLPWPTQLLLDIGDVWLAWWPGILGGLALTITLFIMWKSTRDGRLVWDEFKLKLPIIGAIWRLGALARFLRTFSVQAANNVPILQALRLSAASSGNMYVEKVLFDISDAVERGQSLSHVFGRYHVFSGIVLQMISSGEEAGRLDELLASAASYFDSLTNDRIDSIMSLINPILTVVIGLAIAGMMVAAFLPVFEIGGTVGG
ncbi:MAG: type II secretion system F family protein [Alphaproteobacteria bacterium]|nr:type II secretion system F family protein [Alphaproteobacteria bacterium]